MACSLCAGTCRFSLVLFLLFRLRRACRFGVGGFFSFFLPSLRRRCCRRLSLRRHFALLDPLSVGRISVCVASSNSWVPFDGAGLTLTDLLNAVLLNGVYLLLFTSAFVVAGAPSLLVRPAKAVSGVAAAACAVFCRRRCDPCCCCRLVVHVL